MQISKRKIAKAVVRFIVAGSAGTVMTRLVTQNIEPEEDDSRLDTARVALGVSVLSWLVQDAAGKKTDAVIDSLAEGWSRKDKQEETPE